MTELLAVLAGLATGLAVCSVAISVWAARLCQSIKILSIHDGSNWMNVARDVGVTRTELTTLKNELELMKQLQYAETGIYNMTTDKSTGKQSWVRAQTLEDNYISQQAGRSPDDVLEAAARMMANGRA
jgi:hypothetical protein